MNNNKSKNQIKNGIGKLRLPESVEKRRERKEEQKEVAGRREEYEDLRMEGDEEARVLI